MKWFQSSEKEVFGKMFGQKSMCEQCTRRCVCCKKHLRKMYWGKYLEQRVYNDKTLKERVSKPSPDEDTERALSDTSVPNMILAV